MTEAEPRHHRSARFFWSRGGGPSHADLSSVLALAGYEEPEEDGASNEEQRVLRALRKAPQSVGRRITEELVRCSGTTAISILKTPSMTVSVRCDGCGPPSGATQATLNDDGYITWDPVVASSPASSPHEAQDTDKPGIPLAVRAVLDA